MAYKSKGKQPYIPLYIGDWEKDTNTISLEAEGALLKLIFKLWNSEDKGLLTISFPQLAILLKKTEELTLKIIRELEENKVLNIEFLPDKKLKIENRRMTREVELSKVRSEIGSLGAKAKKANRKQKPSKPQAKGKQIAEIDIDNVIEYLNNKISADFKKETKATRAFITARFKENHTVEDFKAVIDHKWNEWGLDPKMSAYLRPETLFGTKFDSYLQASKIVPNIKTIKNEPASERNSKQSNGDFGII